MKRYFYSATLKDFLSESFDSIFGKISNEGESDSAKQQKNAWVEEIEILKKALKDYSEEDAWIVFEYSLFRLGKRIDTVLLLHDRVFVLEFKIGAKKYERQDIDQVINYALDLKYFHQGSKDRLIIPVLIASECLKVPEYEYSNNNDIYSLIKTNSECLGDAIAFVLNNSNVHKHGYEIDLRDWVKSRYAPTPTIIEAAKALYLNHTVEDITKHEADGAQLDRTTNFCIKIIQETKQKRGKSILFVTGVPGAGKTLVGLNVAIKQSEKENGASDKAVYLSGNDPLVKVLTEALAEDKKNQEKNKGNKKYTKEIAVREVKQFIQMIYGYRKQMLSKTRLTKDGRLEIDRSAENEDKKAGYAEVENIAIFDEAQRAWNREHLTSWLKRKSDFKTFSMSEGEFLIWSLDQRPDWSVIICLVGGGQEINTGEAGIGEWIRALNEKFPNWHIYISNQLSAKEYAEGNIKQLLSKNNNVHYSDDLHLGVSMRSFRAEKLSEMVHALLEGDVSKAKKIYSEIKDKYPIVLTRDINQTKIWLKEKSKGNERYGLVVSSKAARLKPLTIDVRSKPSVKHWFLSGKDDVRSSLFLEDAATEFDVQGLELDYVGLIWDGDLRRKKDSWGFFEFKNGTKWNNVKQQERREYQLNAYRVLLTRARQGMIICVPEGSAEDATRKPEIYNKTYEYLNSIGFEKL